MQDNLQYPFSDDLMVFDEVTHRYIITEAALEREGIFLRARLDRSPMINASNVINGFCKTASSHIYNYIHKFSNDNTRQDLFVAKVPSLRNIIYNALVEQVKYIYTGGDRTLSAKKEEQAMFISPMAVDILNTVAPEIGCNILYSGGFY